MRAAVILWSLLLAAGLTGCAAHSRSGDSVFHAGRNRQHWWVRDLSGGWVDAFDPAGQDRLVAAAASWMKDDARDTLPEPDRDGKPSVWVFVDADPAQVHEFMRRIPRGVRVLWDQEAAGLAAMGFREIPVVFEVNRGEILKIEAIRKPASE
ncbi:MAG: hypothetical protein GMKNLPBB_02270 [Myxococcota bacterium]|nr:hypothetical protein [Myxococcota bacterium]